MPSALSPPQALKRSPHASAFSLQRRPTGRPFGWVIPSGLVLVPFSSAAPRELGNGSGAPALRGATGAADAVRAWDDRLAAREVSSVDYVKGLLAIARAEETARAAIVNCKPHDDRETRMKLNFVAAYLIATTGTLTANEMHSLFVSARLGTTKR